jgi:acylphosphatase
MSKPISVLVRIEGRVQGVWFRAWSAKEASSLGLAGWVRNRRDGSVEAVFSGPENVVGEMLEKCWDGPILAQVRTIVDEPCAPPTSGFHQLPTG